MIHELDVVALEADLPKHGLKSGDVGTVVLAHGDAGYEVEFMTLGGETLTVASLAAAQIRPIGPREIAHVRTMEGVAPACYPHGGRPSPSALSPGIRARMARAPG